MKKEKIYKRIDRNYPCDLMVYHKAIRYKLCNEKYDLIVCALVIFDYFENA